MEAVSNVRDDIRPDELHCDVRPRTADTYDDYVGFHRDSELKDLNNMPFPTHKFTQEMTTAGFEFLLEEDQMSKTSAQEMTIRTFSDTHPPVHAVENSDHYSLTSSTRSTFSSALSKIAASSDADSSAKTVSTAPTSMLSCPSGLDGIREVEKGVFAAPKMAMEPKDRLAWDKIQPKLQDTIFNTFQPRRDLDDAISCEFMMGGPSPTRLTPTVFLVCCHELYRKQLRSILKRQKWMRAYKYQCVVIVDTLEDLTLGALANTHSNSQLLVEAFVPSDKTSWCGLKARAQSRIYQEPINFTIGGILLIDSEAFGLTVKHGIDRLIHAYDDSSDHDDDPGVNDSSSPFISFHGTDDSHIPGDSETEKSVSALELQQTAPHVCMNLVNDDSLDKTHLGGERRLFGKSDSPQVKESTIVCGRLDWTLLKFEPPCEVPQSSLVNTLVTPSNDHLETKAFLETSTLTCGEVWINAGLSGPVKGWLVDCPALLHRHGKSFEVLRESDIWFSPKCGFS